MKKNISLTIDIKVYEKMQKVASLRGCSVSSMVEAYFRRMVRRKKKIKK